MGLQFIICRSRMRWFPKIRISAKKKRTIYARSELGLLFTREKNGLFGKL